MPQVTVRHIHSLLIMALALLSSPIATYGQAVPITYEMREGDTLWSVGPGFGCTVEELQAANHLLDDDEVPAGTLIRVPQCDDELFEPVLFSRYHHVEPGEDLEEIAEQYGCAIPEIGIPNGLESDLVFAGQDLIIPRCGVEVPRRYGARVRPGDDLPHFARRHDCSVATIVEANHLEDGMIRAGQRLAVPDDCVDPFAERLEREIDATTLTELIGESGVRIPREFGAYVIEVVFDEGRRHIIEEHRYDYRGSSNTQSWNPASTVKIYPAITALRRIRELGFAPSAQIVFEGGGETSIEELVREALGPSNNVAYDYLVAFTGLDHLNGFLRPANGFDATAIGRPYALRDWMRAGMPASLRWTPPMLIEDDEQSLSLRAEVSMGETFCGSSACTTLADLGETLRRIMLQEYLGDEGLGLHYADVALVRELLSTTRERGEEVVTALRLVFPEGTRFYHKAGYSNRWYSDNVFIDDPMSDRVWILTMVGHHGRDALDRVTPVVGEILASGRLTAAAEAAR